MPEFDEAQGWHPGHNPWAVALTVTLATFMEVMDTSIANVALPHIAGGLSAGLDESTWVLTSYLVSNAIVLPVSAWLSDRYGRKRFYMSCVALFTASSLMCGIAPSLGLLILFRILQGMGGGGLGPSEQAILADTFPARQRGMAFAVYGMAVVLAPAVGPTLGGWITDHFSWRWIFYVNVPFGILSLSLTSFMVSDPPHIQRSKEQARGTPIDFLGLTLIATGLGAMQVVLDKGQRDDWFGSSFIVAFSITSVAALAAFLFWEWNHKYPIVRLHLFKNRSFAVANAVMLVAFAALLGSTVLLPLFLQTEMGYTAQLAGEVLSPGAFGVILVLPLVGWLVNRVDARLLVSGGLLLSAWGLFHFMHLYPGIDFRTAVWWRVLQVSGIGFLFVPINTISYNGMRPEDSNQVSAMVNLMRNVGGSVGISASTTLLARRQQVHQNYLVARVFDGNPHLQQVLTLLSNRLDVRGGASHASKLSYGRIFAMVQQQAAVLSYDDVFRVMGVVCLIAVAIVWLAKKSKPGQARMGH